MNVSKHSFSLRWEQAAGCVDHYHVSLLPAEGKVTVHPAHGGYVQVQTHFLEFKSISELFLI